MIRQATFASVMLTLALTTSSLQAVDYFWEGGAGNLSDSNYTTVTPPATDQPPGGGTDVLWFGADGSTTLSGSFSVGRMRLGHNNATLPGSGTVTVTSGGDLQLTNGVMGINNAALWVGNARDGVLNIEQGGFVTASRLVQIGVGSNQNFSGTINIRTGGILSVVAGDVVMGDATGAAGNGVPGHLKIDDSSSFFVIAGDGADMDLSPRLANTSYTQTDGTVTINDLVQVTTPTSRATATSFSISGGSFTTGTGSGLTNGNFFVGRGASQNATVNVSGTAVLNIGHRYLMGGSATTGTDPGQLPAGSHATGIVTNQTGGTVNVDRDIRIADAAPVGTSDSTYNLSSGTLNTNVASYSADETSSVIGRQGTGRFIQTGGAANFNAPLVVGNREAATATTANGLYEISAGDLNVVLTPTATTTQALSIAPNGTGEFRVVGDDATIDVTGDFAISTTANGNGTLAFETESGESLSMINIVGAATFNAGSILAFDFSNAAPTQTTYDVLTATSISDLGISFSGSGWDYQIVSGGNGQILQLIQGDDPGLTGDHNGDGIVNAADYVAWRKLNTNGEQGYTDFRTQFGQSAPGGGSAGQVPEPAAAALVLIAICAVAGCRSRVIAG